MFGYRSAGFKLSRGAPRLVEAVEQPEDRLGSRPGLGRVLPDLLPHLIQPFQHRRVDLLVAEQDLAVELPRLPVLGADQFSKAFATEHETYCLRAGRTGYAPDVSIRPKAGSGPRRRPPRRDRPLKRGRARAAPGHGGRGRRRRRRARAAGGRSSTPATRGYPPPRPCSSPRGSVSSTP